MARFGPSVVVAAVMTLAVTPSGARSPASIDARLEVRIEPSAASARVDGRVRWTNHTAEPVSELCLVFDGPPASAVSDPGIADLRVADGQGRTLDSRWPTPGVATIVFDEPVEPATPTALRVTWSGRTVPLGRGGDGSPWGVGGSFPRLIVPTSPGDGCDPRAAAERGRYRLVVDVPTGWRVAAAGSDVGRQQPSGADDARDRTVWSADGVDSVGWAAVELRDSVIVEGDFDPLEVPSAWVAAAAETLERSPVELQLPPVHVRVVTRPELAVWADRLLDEVRTALAWFGLAYGGYPWPQLDLVLVEDRGGTFLSVAPTLAVVAVPGAEWPFDPTGAGELRRRAAAVVAAETFRSVVTFDLSAPEWLAPGIERYAVTSYRAWRLARSGRDDGEAGGPWTRCRLELAAAEGRRPPAVSGDGELLAALVLRSVDRHAGRDAVARGLRDVAEDARLGVASYGALRDALSKAAGEDLGPLLDEVMIARRPPDWTVRHVEGLEATGSDGGFRTTVELTRSHAAGVPVVVHLGMADGTHERRRWDGREPIARWTLETGSRVTSVVIDPDVEWPVEVRRADNAWQAAGPWWLLRPRPPWLAPGLHLIGLLTWPWA